VIDRFEEQLRSAFPAGAITRVQVLKYGDDPEVEPEKTAIRVFFDWPGRTEGKKANPKTVHAFVNANGAAIEKLGDELPPFIGRALAAARPRARGRRTKPRYGCPDECPEPPRSFRRLHLVRGRWSRGKTIRELPAGAA
jgi:hypothetical protein